VPVCVCVLRVGVAINTLPASNTCLWFSKCRKAEPNGKAIVSSTVEVATKDAGRVAQVMRPVLYSSANNNSEGPCGSLWRVPINGATAALKAERLKLLANKRVAAKEAESDAENQPEECDEDREPTAAGKRKRGEPKQRVPAAEKGGKAAAAAKGGKTTAAAAAKKPVAKGVRGAAAAKKKKVT
jgi:hypothetical protein